MHKIKKIIDGFLIQGIFFRDFDNGLRSDSLLYRLSRCPMDMTKMMMVVQLVGAVLAVTPEKSDAPRFVFPNVIQPD